MKALKRATAAEYSQELGVKSYEGQKRLAQLGFRVGGSAGFGLRRMLLSSAGDRMTVCLCKRHIPAPNWQRAARAFRKPAREGHYGFPVGSGFSF